MKLLYSNPNQEKRLKFHILTTLIAFLFISPLAAFSQTINDVDPIVECVEYIGNGKYQATFGYNNLGIQEITIPDTNSNLIINYGQTQIKALNTFKAGRQSNVFQKEFNSDDRCTWRFVLPNGTIKETSASINSSHCNDGTITSKYAFPRGGKESNSKIGAELTALYYLFKSGVTISSDELFRIKDATKVLVEIFTTNVNGIISTYKLLSADVLIRNSNSVVAFFPINSLLNLNRDKTVNYVIAVYTPVSNTGAVNTQGDHALMSDWVRDAYQLDGSGIKIGVISDSYNKLGTASEVELPANVQIVKEYPFSSGTDEGRAMFEIIHDVAPGANLAFRTGFLGPDDMVNGITELKNAGCKIIVDDVTYITEPFFEDGIVGKKIDEVVQNGVVYFTSAGNFGNKSYQSGLKKAIVGLTGISGVLHDFSIGDVLQSIDLKSGEYTIALQWDGLRPTDTDLDIFITDENGNNPVGFNRDNVGGEPIEVFSFSVKNTTVKPANIVISKVKGRDNVKFKYIVFRGGTLISTNQNNGNYSTIVGHANAAGAISVGAVRYSATPAFNGTDLVVEPFSSIGEISARNKPDFSAPDGVNTTVFSSFYGTSAAAPHAAAVAALIMQGKSLFYTENIGQAAIKNLMSNTAIDMYSVGYDIFSGAGLIQADRALKTFANPKPKLECLQDLRSISETKFEITVTGKYFINSSVIYFDNAPVSTSFISETELKAVIPPPYTGNIYSDIKVRNPSKAGGTDGGYSNSLTFEHPCKIKVIIDIKDITKKYGQPIPTSDQFTAKNYAEISVGTNNGFVPLASTEIVNPEEKNRINSILLSTSANQFSDVGEYLIKVSNNDPLVNNVDVINSLDAEILKKYIFEVRTGVITIERMGLMIKPQDSNFTYGDKIPEIKYNYQFEDQDVRDVLTPLVKPLYESALVDYIPRIKINSETGLAQILQNKNFLTSTNAAIGLSNNVVEFNTVSNGAAFALVNGAAFALVNGAAFALVNGQAFALVNGQAYALVNGQAYALVKGQAYALVNGQAYALVNGELYSLLDGTQLDSNVEVGISNGAAFALVNGQAYALVNGVAFALVNGTAYALVNAELLTTYMASLNQNGTGSGTNLILNDADNAILSGATNGYVTLKPVTLVTGNTVQNSPHFIIPGTFLSPNFEVSYAPGNLTINPKDLYVNARFNVVNGVYDVDYTFSGFVEGEGKEVLTSLNYELNSTGEYSYELCPVATAHNYNIIEQCSNYNNPFGPGTSKLRSYLNCIEDLGNNNYVAHFGWINDNTIPVFVAIGDNNYLSPLNTVDVSKGLQPEFFPPGTGNFDIYYSGTKLTWTISSYETNHKSSTTTGANSDSPKCQPQTKSATIVTATQPDVVKQYDVTAYPNPTTGKLMLMFSIEPEMDNIITTDVMGRSVEAEKTWFSSTRLELDLSGLLSGIYLITVKNNFKNVTFRIVKQ